MNLSDSRIMQLYRRAIIKIKKKMASNGIEVKKSKVTKNYIKNILF